MGTIHSCWWWAAHARLNVSTTTSERISMCVSVDRPLPWLRGIAAADSAGLTPDGPPRTAASWVLRSFSLAHAVRRLLHAACVSIVFGHRCEMFTSKTMIRYRVHEAYIKIKSVCTAARYSWPKTISACTVPTTHQKKKQSTHLCGNNHASKGR